MSDDANSATGKRGRAGNFTQQEKALLAELVSDYPAIECKKTDSVAAAKKNAAWADLRNAYNAVGYENRTEKELRTRWKNMKRVAKNDNAALKREIRKTGVGVNEADPVSELVSAVIPAQINSIPSIYDDDYISLTMAEGDTSFTVSSIGQILDCTTEMEDDASAVTNNENARSMGGKQHSCKTSSTRKRSIQNLKVELLEAKLEEMVEKKQMREEERKMRREEHEAKMKFFKLRTEMGDKCASSTNLDEAVEDCALQ